MKKENLTSGQTYFYVSSGGKVEQDTWAGSQRDQNRLEFGNVFTDRQQAQDHLKQIIRTTERQTA